MGSSAKIPRHVAVIMDGNGRWARSRGLERFEGHIQGVESVREAIKSSVRRGVRYLTLYVFSTENWGRPAEEVDALMELFCTCVEKETPMLIEEGVAIRIIGDREVMPAKVKEKLTQIEVNTARGDKLTVMLALNYSSRTELATAFCKIYENILSGRICAKDINPQTISENLYTAGCPDPDLLIRTGGECRLSNFLLWQASYSELYFTETLWPDFGPEEFDKALEEYASRDRRYGLVKSKEDIINPIQ